MDEHLVWFKRAKSNLAIAKTVVKDEYEVFGGEIFFEELCFELQQCVEKALKALMIYNKIQFPKTHDIDRLITALKQNSIILPEKILDAAILTQYAVATRYPDSITKITQEDYEEALEIAENVCEWVEEQMN